MNHCIKTNGKRMTALFLVLVLALSMFSTTAFAAQEDNYHDPAEHWLNAANRTNELDANAVVTSETFNCAVCGASRSFKAWRTPEYTRNGETAMTMFVIRTVRSLAVRVQVQSWTERRASMPIIQATIGQKPAARPAAR